MKTAIVIGGSLAGLFTALLLRQAGWDATVYERTTGDLSSRGAGVGTHVEQFDIMRRLGIDVDPSIGVQITARICLARDGSIRAEIPFRKVMSAWSGLYRPLRQQLPDAAYRSGMQLETVEQQPDGVTAVFTDGSRVRADLLVGADGVRSAVRQACFGAVEPEYAGYIAWRGLMPEHQVPPESLPLIENFLFYLPPHGQILSYPVPDDARPGQRGLNWIWYHPAHATRTLPDLCTDATGRRHGNAIPPPLIRPDVIAAFKAEAKQALPPQYATLMQATPAPFFQPIFDLASPRVANGRVALVGDAAFVARPHVAAGVVKAALNATWLVDALIAEPNDVVAGLASYGERAGAFGDAMVARARYLGAELEEPRRTGLPTDPITVMRETGVPLQDIPGLVV